MEDQTKTAGSATATVESLGLLSVVPIALILGTANETETKEDNGFMSILIVFHLVIVDTQVMELQ